MRPTSRDIYMGLVGVVVGALAFAAIGKGAYPDQVNKTSFSIVGPKGWGSLEFAVEGDGVDYEHVLERMFSSKFYKDGTLGWLEQKKIVPLESESLAVRIEADLCDAFPDQPSDLRMRKKRECADKPSVKGLRDLAFSRRARPFHYVENVGRAGIPAHPANKPRQGYANVCKPGDYYGKRLQVGNPRNNSSVEVVASGSYICTEAAKFPDIQLSTEDARTLFQGANLDQTETVVIAPIE